jgi:hypothetical protein
MIRPGPDGFPYHPHGPLLEATLTIHRGTFLLSLVGDIIKESGQFSESCLTNRDIKIIYSITCIVLIVLY